MLQEILYFSDVSACQNTKKILVLPPYQDFGGRAMKQNGISTPFVHGDCNGLGGALKRLAARANLQIPYEDQIITPLQLLKSRNPNIIALFFV